ncbi:DUF1127 domain-containing protein [Microvirga tunisiensis]|uniref:DUF1127 domain-containing protein n=1 Tax=Microvirga tunisiensis TaxID=2108360 RepID=A0A5N7MHQ4_9HYPH|nr:DUF1127 domain-containing protein [Microvirga tunisiensis]MPR08037.1 DUF1127 domain-containing protein [Microvirga tunisiensis]MPR26348.1 DUF1127 domain-containing protein [Microvirga tunisiensis]
MLSLVLSSIQAVRKEIQVRHAMRDLLALEDRSLRDLGVSPTGVEQAVRTGVRDDDAARTAIL